MGISRYVDDLEQNPIPKWELEWRRQENWLTSDARWVAANLGCVPIKYREIFDREVGPSESKAFQRTAKKLETAGYMPGPVSAADSDQLIFS